MSALSESRSKGCTCVWEDTDLISYPDPDCVVHSAKTKKVDNMSNLNETNKEVLTLQSTVSFSMHSPSEKVEKQIENNFTYHPPKGDQVECYQMLRDRFKDMAIIIATLTPSSREQSIALTELESAMMWANAAIARNE